MPDPPLRRDGVEALADGLDSAHDLVRAIREDLPPEEASKKLREIAEERMRALSWQQNEGDEAHVLARSLETDGYAFDGRRLLPATPAPVTSH